MQWNAEGVFHKEDELQHLLLNKDIDICCIQETHLKEGNIFNYRVGGIRNLLGWIDRIGIREGC